MSLTNPEPSTSSGASIEGQENVPFGDKNRKSIKRTNSRASSAPTRKSRGRATSIRDVLTLRNGSIFNPNDGKKRSRDRGQPGLRAMLYGLTMKMEREEANFKKMQIKRLGEYFIH
ncbi:hypothetical protein DdX_05363 [Ditylenchus destructor]|uniref:Uncharacterized protein n=1 Tax=Ditylenchus destructor TaxID=166010 RepID=A0AAD4R9R8_9BILA|nr:hypothetical protein DdX_05363 [Ditylenchus destructor]